MPENYIVTTASIVFFRNPFLRKLDDTTEGSNSGEGISYSKLNKFCNKHMFFQWYF